MTLRTRLAVMFGVVAIVASTLVGLLAYRSTAAELADTTDTFLLERSAELTSGRRATPGESRRGTPDADIGAAADDDSIIQIIGPSGRVITSSEQLPVSDRLAELQARPQDNARDNTLLFEDIEVSSESYRMLSRVGAEGATIQIARSTTEDDAVLAALVARISIITLLVAGAAAAIGWYIASRATSPLRRLASVANDVAQTGDLGGEALLAGIEGDDEIGGLATSFRSMLSALDASREQQHRLIHDAGHELRTPLTSLRANIEMLERATELPTDQRAEIVGAIKLELVELSDLFDEMIDLATDRHTTEIAFEPVDLDQVVRTVAERWGRRSDRSIVIDAVPTLVSGDLGMLERAVSNLVDNADKFSAGTEPIEITARAGAVSVRDHGPGVPVDDRARIFERFHRSETTRSMPGSGLGLSIVAQIVARHGGEVWVTDAPSGGAEVGFRLQPIDAGVTPDAVVR